MTQDPYQAPKSDVQAHDKKTNERYSSYSEVPWYRRQWAFWLMYFTINPVALGILVFGDIYYVKKDKVVSFGIANRVVAGLIGIFALYSILGPNSV